ncbi:hypothetical protein B4072_1207 [Bacillus subtilis]|nr:hypothetical protein B4069_1172 [Bacillus subtilis]KIN43674.1 hypothetical protein B4072_1207 [Bacillus subtilis]KZD76784.1 hypothetical protein B4417_4040 [Bacillus subtilis]
MRHNQNLLFKSGLCQFSLREQNLIFKKHNAILTRVMMKNKVIRS